VSVRGRIDEVTWTSAMNTQTTATFALVGDAIITLTPRFRGGRLVQGDTWSYELPLPGGTPTNGVEVEGALKVNNTLRGTARIDEKNYVVIEQKLELAGKGKQAATETSKASSFTIEGSGQGLVLFDKDAGTVHRYGVSLEQTMTVESGAQKATQKRTVELEASRL